MTPEQLQDKRKRWKTFPEVIGLLDEIERLQNGWEPLAIERNKLKAENEYFSEEITRYRKALEEIANGEWPAHYNNDGDEKNWCQVRAIVALEGDETA